MEPGYEKADGNNLPTLDVVAVAEFFKNNPDFCSAEFRNVKTSLATRQNYGDDAIGYVQLKREHNKCFLRCRITPEHKVRSTAYKVTMVVDEEENVVTELMCHNCAASAGGCKHAAAFLMWVHRRSEEPSRTSVDCYWKKSTLSRIGTSLKYVTSKELSSTTRSGANVNASSHQLVFDEFIKEARNKNLDCQLLKHQLDFDVEGVGTLSMHNLMLNFIHTRDATCVKFIEMLKMKMTNIMCDKVEKATRSQYKTGLWYELRYGRITASKAFDVSRCKTARGTLVALIMGAKFPDTTAMKRGRDLEKPVKMIAQSQLKEKFRDCGLFISSEYPMLAASPDGLAENYVIEVKCPTSDKMFLNYIKAGEITKKYMAQVQLQMFICKKRRCCFCVADANFELNKCVHIFWINYDESYISELINLLQQFWCENIYPRLCENI